MLSVPDYRDQFNRLGNECADADKQADADRLYNHMSSRSIFDHAPYAIRASSPHVLVIHNGMDTQLELHGKDDLVGLTLCPVDRERSTFGFNMGVAALGKSLDEVEKIDDVLASNILSSLEIGTDYSDHGDLPGYLHMTCLDKTGTMLMRLENPESRLGSGDLSALFSASADIAPGAVPVSPQIMEGLWTLALSLKIQQQAEEDGTKYDLMRLGVPMLYSGNRASVSKMLLALDAK